MNSKIVYSKDLLESNVKDCYTLSELCKRLGLAPRGSNFSTLKRKLDEFGVSYSHFTGRGWNKGQNLGPKKQLSEILIQNSLCKSYVVLRRLINEGLKERKCEKCGLSSWNGEQIPLELHHINGKHEDNRFENLMILCPNCHAQTDNYRGKNVKTN